MTAPFICTNCGTQYAPSSEPPDRCVICTDDRQYVAPGGQEWTTHDQLARRFGNRVELDGNLVGIGIDATFAIPQRALVVPTDTGNVLWDCVSIVTPEALDAVEALGGIRAIAISHPHFYSSMVEWSEALGGVPIHLHRGDARWIQRPSPQIALWDGNDLDLGGGARLLHLPGHFPGSAALHWTGPDRTALLAGDSLLVGADHRTVTVMHSVPNLIPVGSTVIRDLKARLAGVDFDDLYGFTWGRNIVGDARMAVACSLDRYLGIVSDHRVDVVAAAAPPISTRW